MLYTTSWGYGVVLISRDWILRLILLFSEMGNLPPNFAENLTVPSFGELS